MKIVRQIFNTENSVKRGILHGVFFLIIDLSYVEQSVQKI